MWTSKVRFSLQHQTRDKTTKDEERSNFSLFFSKQSDASWRIWKSELEGLTFVRCRHQSPVRLTHDHLYDPPLVDPQSSLQDPLI